MSKPNACQLFRKICLKFPFPEHPDVLDGEDDDNLSKKASLLIKEMCCLYTSESGPLRYRIDGEAPPNRCMFEYLVKISGDILNDKLSDETYSIKRTHDMRGCFQVLGENKKSFLYDGHNGNIRDTTLQSKLNDFFHSLRNWLNQRTRNPSAAGILRMWLHIFLLISDGWFFEAESLHISLNEKGKALAQVIADCLEPCALEDKVGPALADLKNELSSPDWVGVEVELEGSHVKVSNFFWLALLATEYASDAWVPSKKASAVHESLTTYRECLMAFCDHIPQRLPYPQRQQSTRTLINSYTPYRFDKGNMSVGTISPNESDSYTFKQMYESSMKHRLLLFGKSGYGKNTLVKAVCLHAAGRSLKGVEDVFEQDAVYPMMIRCSGIEYHKSREFIPACLVKTLQQMLSEIHPEKLYKEHYLSKIITDVLAYHAETGKRLLLTINKLEDLENANDDNRALVYRLFMENLNRFLNDNPHIHCIVSASDTLSGILKPQEYDFTPFFLHRLTKDQIVNYSRKFYEHTPGVSPEEADARVKRIDEQIHKMPHVRRVLHRRLYLDYFLHDSLSNSAGSAPKNALTLIRQFTNNTIASFLAFVNEQPEHATPFEETDIHLILSYVANFIIDRAKGDVHLSKKEYDECLSQALSKLKFHLTRSVQTSTTNAVKELFAHHDFWMVKRDVGYDGMPERFSFASRPILLYYGAYAIAQCITTEGCSFGRPDYAKEFIKNHMEQWSRQRPFLNDWADMIAWICYLLQGYAEPIVGMLIDSAKDSSVVNRPVRVLSVCALTILLSMRPHLSQAMIREGYRAAFECYFFKEELVPFHDLIKSVYGYDFVNTVFGAFMEDTSSEKRTQMAFPRYIWVVGYLDTLQLFGCLKISHSHSRVIDALKAKKERLNEQGKFKVSALIAYIDLRINAGETQGSSFIRLVAILATIYWLEFHEGKSNVNDIDDTNQFEIGTDSKFFAEANKCLIQLLRCTNICAANLACYALAHAVNNGKIDVDEVIKELGRIVEIDCLVRRAFRVDRYSDYFVQGISYPLCGALRLITVLPMNRLKKNSISVESWVRKVYQEEWKLCREAPEQRHSVLLAKIGCLVQDFLTDEEVNEVIAELRLMLSDTEGKKLLLPYDGDQTILHCLPEK